VSLKQKLSRKNNIEFKINIRGYYCKKWVLADAAMEV
jgi:hypothetical protein